MKLLSRENQQVDITRILLKLRHDYNTLYTYQFDDNVFIYRPVGRKEYKELYLNDRLDEISKEEVLCRICVLYPANFDFENCDEAGLPTKLAEEIVKNSYLAPERRERVLNYFRQDMYDLDNQKTCVILEAFPSLDMETVENWDIETTCKYYARAEWILHNLHGLQIREKDPDATYYGMPQDMRPQTEEFDPDMIQSTTNNADTSHNGTPKQKTGNTTLTPEKLRELKEKYPNIDWEHDSGMQGIDGLASQPTVDTTSPALMTPKQWAAMRPRPDQE
jgi:hypothetical protein